MARLVGRISGIFEAALGFGNLATLGLNFRFVLNSLCGFLAKYSKKPYQGGRRARIEQLFLLAIF